MKAVNDRNSLKSRILPLFTTQNPNMIMKALDEANNHALSWFYPLKSDFYRTAKDGDAISALNHILIEKLDVWTMGFDIDQIVALSGEMQESAETKDYFLVFLPFEDCSAVFDKMILQFTSENQLEFSPKAIHAIRKQLNLSEDGALAICKSSNTGKFYTVGILSKEGRDCFPRIYFSKHLQWEFYLPKSNEYCSTCEHNGHCKENKHYNTCPLCRLRYERGTLMIPNIDLSRTIHSMLINILKASHHVDPVSTATQITPIIKATDLCKRGAVLIFSEANIIESEAQRLTVKNKRGFCLEKPLQLNKSNTETLIPRMASIDGAILLDYAGKCYAYGVILDGRSVLEGCANRGARYNSAKAYIDFQQKGCSDCTCTSTECRYSSVFIGVVKSEDGALDIFPQIWE